MNKWLWLLLIVICWIAAGFVISNHQQAQDKDIAPLSTKADRIVSLAPNLTEILFALGLEKEIVRVTLFSDYPPAALKKPKVGTFWQPNIEAVVAARPSIVIML